MNDERIYLSPPHRTGDDEEYLLDALRSNWIAPLGPHVDAFERELSRICGVRAGAALSSGTAALHLALLLVGVKAGDEVLVSTLTFAGSVFPIRYIGAEPVFIDSERRSWNLDPALVEEAIEEKAARGRPPAAVIVVHLYGQAADMEPILDVCRRHGIPVIEDAAEALGATYNGAPVGSLGQIGVFSFNGNKILTTSGGGMLVTDAPDVADRARILAAQAREPLPYYEHREIGFNYRMSNLLAALGRAQLRALQERVELRRSNFERYRAALGDIPGIDFMPEAPWAKHTRWLTTLTFDRDEIDATPETVRRALEVHNIETRPLWKPMHEQPVFAGHEVIGGGVAEDLFERGLCLPSGSDLGEDDMARIVDNLRFVLGV